MEMASYFIKEQKNKFKFNPMDLRTFTEPPWLRPQYNPRWESSYDQEVMLHGVSNSDINLAFTLENISIENEYEPIMWYERTRTLLPDRPQSKDIKLTCLYNPDIYVQLVTAMDDGKFLVLSQDHHVQQQVNEHTWFMYSVDANERGITIELRSRGIRQSGGIQRREDRNITQNPWLR